MKRKALRFGRGFRVALDNGRHALRTLNVYVPPAYTPGGNVLPRGRR